MRAIEILVEEHEVIGRLLIHLEQSAKLLEERTYPPVRFFEEALDLCRELADGYHHDKEEDVLFSLLLDKPEEDLREEVRRHAGEHEDVRILIRKLADLLEPYSADPAGAAPALRDRVMDYVHTLRCHIRTEDEILFPMAQESLTDREAAAVLEGYGKFGSLDGEALSAFEDRVWELLEELPPVRS